MGTTHHCTTDGAQIICICSTGRDHDEDEMDLDSETVTDELVEPNDRFTGMADTPVEDVIE